MFTGITQATVRIRSLASERGGKRLVVDIPRSWKLIPGESVSVDGVCLSVDPVRGARHSFFLMPETLSRSIASGYKAGSLVNVERSLRAGDLLGGHIVQGHSDGVGVVERVRLSGARRDLFLALPKELRRFIAEKGSLAVNGVSLTVAEKTKKGCRVSLIPITIRSTNLGKLQAGDAVNVEVDIVARYLDALRKRG